MGSHLKLPCKPGISSPADAWKVVGFSVRPVHRQQQIRNLSPKRCHPVHRLFAYITVQKNTVRFHIFRFPLQNFNFPDKYGKHQTVSSFLMLIIGTEQVERRTAYEISVSKIECIE